MTERIIQHCRRERLTVRGEFENNFIASSATHWARVFYDNGMFNVMMMFESSLVYKTHLLESDARFWITKYANTRAVESNLGLFNN